MLTAKEKKEKDFLIGVKDVARMAGLSIHTIHAKVANRQIPFHRLPGGTKLIFLRTEVISWLTSDEHSAF